MLRKITLQFAASLIVSCDDPESAIDLYRTAALLPNTTTLALIQSATQVTVKGPLNLELPHILTAADRGGRQLIVKILRNQSANYEVPRSVQQEILGFEASLVDQLGLALDAPSPYNLVPRNAVPVPMPPPSIESAGDATAVGEFTVLVMPRYICTVASSLRFSFQALFEGGKRMVRALDFLHSRAIAHLDVKGGNIFVDQPGQ